MARTVLTDAKIRALPPPTDATRRDLLDAHVPGLLVRVTAKKHKTFYLRARWPGKEGADRRELGEVGAITLEQARAKALRWLRLLDQGIDPVAHDEQERQAAQRAALRRHENSFSAVAEDFIKDKLATERRGKEVEKDIRREFLPAWNNRPVTEITAYDVRAIVKAAKDRGSPYQAHSLLSHARRLFNWAVDQQVYGLETSPCERLKPKAIIGAKKARERDLNDDELRAFWNATGRMDYPWGPMFRLLLLTGQRKTEASDAQWREFDLDKERLWSVPAERFKSGVEHLVPLSDDARALLDGLWRPKYPKGDFVFSTTFGKKPVEGFSKAKSRLDGYMQEELGAEVPPWVIHDLRRTVRTRLSQLRVPYEVRELVIGHVKRGLTKTYDRYDFLDEKREALEMWARKLRSVVEPKLADDNVVPLRGVK
jgi:integrase